MNLFSKLFGNKNIENTIAANDSPKEEKKAYVPPDDFLTMAKKLDEHTITKNSAIALNKLYNNPNSQKSDYFKFLATIKTIIAKEEGQYVDFVALNKLKEDSITLSDAPFVAVFNGFVSFYDDFPFLKIQHDILKALFSTVSNDYERDEFKLLYEEYKLLGEAFEAAKHESSALKLEQDELTIKIEEYANTVNEYKQKYKLSIDWEGKKPYVAALGKKLQASRSSLMEREAALSNELRILYSGYPKMHSTFCENLDYFKHCLNEKISSFSTIENEITAVKEIYSMLEQALIS